MKRAREALETVLNQSKLQATERMIAIKGDADMVQQFHQLTPVHLNELAKVVRRAVDMGCIRWNCSRRKLFTHRRLVCQLLALNGYDTAYWAEQEQRDEDDTHILVKYDGFFPITKPDSWKDICRVHAEKPKPAGAIGDAETMDSLAVALDKSPVRKLRLLQSHREDKKLVADFIALGYRHIRLFAQCLANIHGGRDELHGLHGRANQKHAYTAEARMIYARVLTMRGYRITINPDNNDRDGYFSFAVHYRDDPPLGENVLESVAPMEAVLPTELLYLSDYDDGSDEYSDDGLNAYDNHPADSSDDE
jgi:hypothetical protein